MSLVGRRRPVLGLVRKVPQALGSCDYRERGRVLPAPAAQLPSALGEAERVVILPRKAPEPGKPLGLRAAVAIEPDLGADHRRLRVHSLARTRGLERVVDSPEREGVDDRPRSRPASVSRYQTSRPRLGGSRHDSGGFEVPQAVGQPSGRDLVQPAKQVGEAPRSELQIAHDQQRPALTNHLKGASRHAEVAVDALGVHRSRPVATGATVSRRYHSGQVRTIMRMRADVRNAASRADGAVSAIAILSL